MDLLRALDNLWGCINHPEIQHLQPETIQTAQMVHTQLHHAEEMVKERITDALEVASWGGIDGDHHKQWVIDQMVRVLTGCPKEMVHVTGLDGQDHDYEALGESVEYLAWVKDYEAPREGIDDPDDYDEWDPGIAP